MENQDNEKVILKISRYGDDSSVVELSMTSSTDMIAVATAIVQIMQKNGTVKKFVKLAEALGIEEFLTEGAVHVPDFNKFLDGDNADPEGE